MGKSYSRRGFLGTALTAGLLPILRGAAHSGSALPKRLVAGTRVLEVSGRPANVFGLIGPNGRPGIRLAAGERFRVDLVNQAGARTIVHWHGQVPPWAQDGFPWPETPPIADGAVQAYDFAPISGTYWMHSHHGLQEQRLMTAPLIVQDVAEIGEDRQEIVLMLHDFTFRPPEEVLAGLTGASAAATEAIVLRAQEAPDSKSADNAPEPRVAGMAPKMGKSGMTMPGS